MDSTMLAKRMAARLQKKVVKQVGILSHIPDEHIWKYIGYANDYVTFTAEDNQTIFDALRAAETWDSAYETVQEYVFKPAWSHWWQWLTENENWRSVEAKVDEERARAARAHAYKAKQDAGLIHKNQIGWTPEWSEKVIRVWEAVQAIRAAFETGVGLQEASEQWYAALDSDGGDWWKHPLKYWPTDLAVDWFYTGLRNWRDEKEGRLDPSYRLRHSQSGHVTKDV